MRRAARAAVLGHPVAHSLSPVLHRAAYADLGLTGWTYDVVDVPDADALTRFVLACDDTWAGLSLTMPLKRLVQPLLDDVSPVAASVGAVNTVVLTGDGRRSGHNTDVEGIVQALREGGVADLRRGGGVVLGGGATAASAVAALADLGDDAPTVVVRSRARAGDVLAAADRLGSRPHVVPFDEAPAHLVDAAAVVSTVPAQAADAVTEAISRSGQVRGALLDVVYDPWPTPPAIAWASSGGVTVGGHVMLLHQAVAQVMLMTGRTPTEPVMRDALEAELSRRAHPPAS